MSIEEALHSLAGNEVLKWFNYLMHDDLFLIIIGVLVLFALLATKKNATRVSIFLTVLLSAVLFTVLKGMYAEPRPCFGLDWCDSSFGFPSGHAAVSFALAAGTFGTPLFYLFAVFAVLVSLSRVIFGVHSFPQVIAGAVLAFVVSIVINRLIERFSKKGATVKK